VVFLVPLFLASSLDQLLEQTFSQQTLAQHNTAALSYIKEILLLSTIPGSNFLLRSFIAEMVPLKK
jgi:hypothetical protein